MRFEELAFVCAEAARDLVSKRERPLSPTVVLPGPERTRILELPGFPDDDQARHDLMANLAHDEVTTPGVPAYGFLAEAELGGEDVLVAVWGARKNHPVVSVAPFTDDGIGAFEEPEPLDPTAFPFLHPMQHAVDSLEGLPDGPPPAGTGGGLPLFDA